MNRSRVIEQCSVLGMLAALGASFWRPHALWPFGLMVASICVNLAAKDWPRTTAAERSARRYWLGPVIVFAMAAQFVILPGTEDRVRMWLYAAILTVAGVVLLVVRRPRA
jgi:hypothetical protein